MQITTMPNSKNAAFQKWLATLTNNGARRWSHYYDTLGTAKAADIMLASDASLATEREITWQTVAEWRGRVGLRVRSKGGKYDDGQRIGKRLNARRAKTIRKVF